MTLAEALKSEGRLEGRRKGREEGERKGRQRGRQEGRQEGVVMGEIRLCETLLGKPVRSLEKLASLSQRQLQFELQTLRAQLQASR
jgi:flagellar biosynthesis/type III secretory pathway protein FliH